jgi:3-oxoacyl-[acyl-carrier protein] reductase
MDLGLEGRVALVIGASRGIGKAIADSLEREGARVARASRSGPIVADTDDLDRMSALPGEVADELGPIEILVANTGGPPFGGVLEHGLEDWERAYRSLVLAPRALISGVLPGMRERGWGRIVNVGSTSTREPIDGLNLSNAHRMAAVGFLKTLSREVAGDGITVNTVATGRFATERLADGSGSLASAEEGARQEVPAGRLGDPAEYGDLVAFLCSERAAYLTGTVIPLDGGILHSAF